MGTVGGNSVSPPPRSAISPFALLALRRHGFGAGRLWHPRHALEEFLAGREPRRRLGGDQRVVPKRAGPMPKHFRYRKISRVKPKGASVISLAIHVPNVGGRVSGARIALWRHGANPAIRAKSAERALEGRMLDESGIAAGRSRLPPRAPRRPPTPSPSAWYRREVVGVHLRRFAAGPGSLREIRVMAKTALQFKTQTTAKVAVFVEGGASLPHGAARRHRRPLAQIRLRPGRLRRLHRAGRRRGASILRHAGRNGRGAARSRPPMASKPARRCIRCSRLSWIISRRSAAIAHPAC